MPQQPARDPEVAGKSGAPKEETLKPLTTPELIRGIRTLLSNQVRHLVEKNVDQFDAKEAALLNGMTKSLDKLVELNKSRKPATRRRSSSAAMVELRKKIAERIAELDRG